VVFLPGISHTFEFNKIVSLKLAASASYLLSTDETTYAKYDSDSLATTGKFNNFHDGMVTVSLPLAVYKNIDNYANVILRLPSFRRCQVRNESA